MDSALASEDFIKPHKRRKASKSPTQRSLKFLRDQGYVAEVVERRVPFQFVTKDLFGFIDIVALKDEETLAVQATSGDNVAARVNKIIECEHLAAVRRANWRIVVHGWRKNASGHWVLREVDVS